MRKILLLLIFTIATYTSWAGKPNLATVSNISNSGADLSWGNATCGILDYQIQYKDSVAVGWSALINIPNSTLTYTLTGLNPTTTYNWRVRCSGGWRDGPNFTTTGCNITNFFVTDTASCDNTYNGAVWTNASNGTLPYTYSWDNGSSADSLTAVLSGLYIVTITDSLGCLLIDSVNVGFYNNKSVSQAISAFIDTTIPNYPGVISAYNKWAFDTLTIINTGCDVNIRPEFIVSHQDSTITLGDFDLKWYNPLFAFWANIPYTINGNGNASGYWHPTSNTTNDSTGFSLSLGSSQQIIIKTRFTNPANYGAYTAHWETFEIVDSLKGQPLSLADSVSLTLVNCNIFSIDSISSSNLSCPGLSDGNAAVLSILNGSGSYSYLWSNTSTNDSISNLSAGTYSVVVTDSSWGCTDSTSITITEPTLSLSLIGTDITCNGANNGTLTASIVGGSGSYKLLWNPILMPTLTQSSLSSGLYSLTVTDLGCLTAAAVTDSFTIIEPDSLTESALSSNNTSCDTTNCNGQIHLSISGGTTPYSIIWSNGDSALSKNTLCPGSYSITITDANTCATFTENISILDNTTIPAISVLATNNESCDTTICNGAVILTENPGATPYSILWNTGDSLNTLSELCGGSYSFTISDTNSCALTDTIAIYDSLTILSIGLFGTDISCNGLLNGSAEAMMLGGSLSNTSTLSYCGSSPYWSTNSNIELVHLVGNDDSIVNNTAGLTDQYEDYTAQYTTLTPGQTYSVQIDLGCISCPGVWNAGAKVFIDWNINGVFDAEDTVGTITNQASPSSNTITFTVPSSGVYGPTRLRVVSQYDNDGFGACDSATLSTVYLPYYGATEDYSVVISDAVPVTYLWNTGDTTSIISNLSAGNYYCVITDTNNCSSTDTVIITEPGLISVTAYTTDVNCNGGSDGTAILNISGGTPGFIEDWGLNNPNSLSAGIYNYTITDTNTCTFSDSINISEPIIALTNSYTSVNINCNGASTGNIDITPFGGTSPYTFAWNNGAITEDLTNVSAGQYIVTITDTNDCNFIDTITLTEPNLLYSSSAQTNVSCYGLNDGSATVNFFGGVTNYILTWDTLSITLPGGLSVFTTPIGVPAGIYPYMVTDDNGCTHTDTIIITGPSQILSTATITNVSCSGLSNGVATLSISGGVPSYIENWGLNNPLSLPAGIYTYSITDSIGCMISDSVTITQPNILDATSMITDVSCFGIADGAATVNISGGTIDYTLYWGVLTYPLAGGLSVFTTPLGVPEGTYPFSITDSNGCSFLDTIIINQPTAISVTETILNVSCYGDSTGTATLSISGGTPGFMQDWGLNNPNSLSAGIYNYTITDTNTCTFSDFVTITEPTEITSSISITHLTSCIIANGSIDLTANGGVGTYTYLWNNNDTTEDISSLSAGNYTIIITDTNGCQLLDSVTVNQPSNGLYLDLTTSSTISCFGASDGEITANASGGFGNLSYTWSTGDTINLIDSLTTGTYWVQITDTNACSLTDSIILIEPVVISTSENTSNILCNGDATGIVSLVISGGTPAYQFSIDGGTTWTLNDTFPGLTAGTYTINIKDTNNCTDDIIVVLTEPLSFNVNDTIIDASTPSSNDGSIDLTVSGGLPPYIYYWTGPGGPYLTEDLTLLQEGIYNLTITDSVGCTYLADYAIQTCGYGNYYATDILCNGDSTGSIHIDGVFDFLAPIGPFSYYISVVDSNGTYPLDSLINTTDTFCIFNNLPANIYTVTISAAAPGCNHILADISVNEANIVDVTFDMTTTQDTLVACFGNQSNGVTVIATGGTGVGSYLYNIPAMPVAAPQASGTFSGLYAGAYTINATDSNGCSGSVAIAISEPGQLIFTTLQQDLGCFDDSTGAVSISASGGTSPYSYLWSTGDTINMIDSLTADTFWVQVTDSLGCFSNPSSLEITINQPNSLHTDYTLTDFNGKNVSCFGDTNATIDVQINGGTSPFTHYFNGSITTNNLIQNLGVGTYTDSIVDSNGCIFTETITITEPEILYNSFSAINMSCNGVCDGTINLQIAGGITPYSYLWNNSSTNSNLDSLCVGNYILTITDTNGCTLTDSVMISEPTAIVINLDISTNVTVYGGNDGALLTSVYGGVSNLNYEWIGPNLFNASTLNISNLVAGIYYLTATDSTFCSVTDTFIVTQPPLLTAYLDSAINLDCNGICTGELYITPDGGNAVYTYLWSGPNGYISTDEDIDNLCAGIYTLEISDSSTTATLHFTILEPTPLMITSIVDTIICHNGTTQANAYVYGGSPAYLTLWSNGSTNTSTIVPAGIHLVSIIDANGCIATDSVTVYQADSLSINAAVINISCYGLQDAEVTLSVTNGGIGPFQYSANNGINYQTGDTFYNLAAGVSNYIVTDANGCSNTIATTISEPDELISTITTTNASCHEECDGTATLAITGGTPTYNSNWGGANPNNLCAGFYNVIVTDANGCSTTPTSTSFAITEPNPVIVNIWQYGDTLEATTGFVSYQWYDGFGSAINGAINDTFTPTIQGEYSVEVTDTNGCRARSNSILVTIEIIDYINQHEIKLNIYPNPTKGLLIIETEELIKNISIINNLGNELIIVENNTNSLNSTKLNLATFAKGIYFIRIELSSQIINYRIVLQ